MSGRAMLRTPILADYAISPLTAHERAKKYRDAPDVVATIGTMSRSHPVTLADLRQFQADLAAMVDALVALTAQDAQDGGGGMSELYLWMLWGFIMGVCAGILADQFLAIRWWRRSIAKLRQSDAELHRDLQALNQDICAACEDVCP